MPILLYKPMGLTPLQAIKEFRRQQPKYTEVRLGAAGRLDPMAEGLLLVMVGEENKRQAEFLELDKTYEAELVVGIRTDSYDVLGMPTIGRPATVDLSRLSTILTELTGEIEQAYPPFSAVRVKGKPLYWWARHNRLDEITIPTKKRQVFELKLLQTAAITRDDLKQLVVDRVAMIEGDFRQDEILSAWQEILNQIASESLPRMTLRIHCSSGTFVRSLVQQIGQNLSTGAITLNIIRTSIGDYDVKNVLRLID